MKKLAICLAAAGACALGQAASALPLRSVAQDACWLQADRAGQTVIVNAYAAPGLEGQWSLVMRHRDGQSLHSEQSGYLNGSGRGPVRLSSLQFSSAGFIQPPRRDFMAQVGDQGGSATLITLPDYRPGNGDRLPIEFSLEIENASGRTICRTREVLTSRSY